MAWGDSVLVLVGGLLRSVVDMYEHMMWDAGDPELTFLISTYVK